MPRKQPPWTQEHERRLRELLGRPELRLLDIARELGVSVRQIAGRMRTTTGGTTQRRCLRCRKLFWSAGPQNRLCRHCNGYAAEAAPILQGMVW